MTETPAAPATWAEFRRLVCAFYQAYHVTERLDKQAGLQPGRPMPEWMVPYHQAFRAAYKEMYKYLWRLGELPPPRGQRQRAVWDAQQEVQRIGALWPDDPFTDLNTPFYEDLSRQADAASTTRVHAVDALWRAYS